MVRSWQDVRLHLVYHFLRRAAGQQTKASDRLVRLGSELGGWWAPEELVSAGTVAYCGGAGEDITFDRELLSGGCEVRTFDPTPLAIAHVEGLEINDERFRFVPVGWWHERDELQFFEARDTANPVNLSALNLQRTTASIPAPVDRLSNLMREQGDERVDLVKIDIEGAEYAVLDSMIEDRILPTALLVEFDQPAPPRKTLSYVRRLRTLGYRLAKIDFYNYTFLRDQRD